MPLRLQNQIVRTRQLGEVCTHLVDLLIDRAWFKHMISDKLGEITYRLKRNGLIEKVQSLFIANPHNASKMGTVLLENIEHIRVRQLFELSLKITNVTEIKKVFRYLELAL